MRRGLFTIAVALALTCFATLGLIQEAYTEVSNDEVVEAAVMDRRLIE